MKKSVIAVLAGLVLAGSSCSVAGANGLRIKPYRFEAAGGLFNLPQRGALGHRGTLLGSSKGVLNVE